MKNNLHATKMKAVVGRWEIDNDRVVYEKPANEQFPCGICLSNVRFSEGEARVTVKKTKDVPVEGRILLGYRSDADEYWSAGLAGGGRGYAVVRFVPPFGWAAVVTAGVAQDPLAVGQSIVLCIRVQGQQVTLEVDDVPILEHVLPTPLPHRQLGLFAWGGQGGMEFTQLSIKPSLVVVPNQVFVVHGHDDAAKMQVALLIERAGLKPIILHEQPNEGRTIIEKFETHGGSAGFAVILLTPDDVGGPHCGKLKPRARQNVIGEMFWFAGKLGRSKVCALKKGEIELPSDFAGVAYTDMDEHGGWKGKLLKELEAAGYTVDWGKALA